MSYLIRLMLPADLDAVLRVQAACYPAPMQEPAAVLHARLRAAGETCAVASAHRAAGGDSAIGGYLFAYPSRLGRVTDLGAPFEVAPQADTLYLHDLAVGPDALGRGLARRLVGHVLSVGRARGLAHSALVSVQDSAGFWHGLGYRAAATADSGLLTYPPGALYMARALD